MNIIKKAIKWFDGKKTAIGAALGTIVCLFVLAGGQVDGYTVPAEQTGWLALIAAVFSTIGLAHKGIKAALKNAEDDKANPDSQEPGA